VEWVERRGGGGLPAGGAVRARRENLFAKAAMVYAGTKLEDKNTSASWKNLLLYLACTPVEQLAKLLARFPIPSDD